jgi:hypothetical protein
MTPPPLTVFEVLNELFETRHELVHEIGPNQMAHFSLRDMWDLDEARRVGEIALMAVRTIEAVITRATPVNFPNRLDEEGQPEDELKKLKCEIAKIEDEITAKLTAVDVWDDAIVWERTLIAQRAAMEAEIKFLDDAGFLRPVRHLDLSLPAKTGYLRNRLAYLTALREELRKTLGS